MIEDLQDEYSIARKKVHKQNSENKGKWSILLVWVGFLIVSTLICLPQIISTFTEKTPKQIFKEAKAYAYTTEQHQATLFFVQPNGKELKAFKKNVTSTGSSLYNDALEGLLEGPSDSILSDGCVTYIAPNTKLLSVTLNGTVVTVNLSSEFLDSQWNDSNYEIAKAQIFNTLYSINPIIETMVVTINGKSL